MLLRVLGPSRVVFPSLGNGLGRCRPCAGGGSCFQKTQRSLASSHKECETPVLISLPKWLEEHAPTLQPPVANKLLYGAKTALQVMVVGGPNERRDFHLQEGEEFFVQLKGTLTLKVVEKGIHRDVVVKAGESFLLPSRVPHSPQREANSLGLVFERSHPDTERDGMLWFDERKSLEPGEPASLAKDVVYEEYFHCTDLGKQLKPVIARYAAFRDDATRKKTAVRVADPPIVADADARLATPAPFDANIDALQTSRVLHRGDEVICDARVGPDTRQIAGSPFDVFVWQRAGTSVCRVNNDLDAGNETFDLGPGDVVVLPKGTAYEWHLGQDACIVSVANVFT